MHDLNKQKNINMGRYGCLRKTRRFYVIFSIPLDRTSMFLVTVMRMIRTSCRVINTLNSLSERPKRGSARASGVTLAKWGPDTHAGQ